jgi:nucleoside-diphosphate-sugar epimerase
MLIPAQITTEEELDAALTQPGPELVSHIRTLSSPLLILGAGGKMGPSLSVMAKRAANAAGHSLDVVAVSRFSNSANRQWLEQHGVRTLQCDLLDIDAVRQLPASSNLVYLVGYKFGTKANPSVTWAMNTVVPHNVAVTFPKARIVALSTGNVYPMTHARSGGADEQTPLTPRGEYPNAAIARERIFEFHAGRNATPLCILRLFYAVELRYGIISELARAVAAGDPIEAATGNFNCIWQRDANDIILRCLAFASSPPAVFNLCLPEIFSVRTIAAELGELLGTAPLFHGAEAATALLGNSTRLYQALRPTFTPIDKILEWTARWVKTGGRDLGKPTHFAVRDGVY